MHTSAAYRRRPDSSLRPAQRRVTRWWPPGLDDWPPVLRALVTGRPDTADRSASNWTDRFQFLPATLRLDPGREAIHPVLVRPARPTPAPLEQLALTARQVRTKPHVAAGTTPLAQEEGSQFPSDEPLVRWLPLASSRAHVRSGRVGARPGAASA